MNEWQNHIGVGSRQSNFHRRVGTKKKTSVRADEGRHQGQVVGSQTEHWSGRVDAKVSRPDVTHNLIARRVEES